VPDGQQGESRLRLTRLSPAPVFGVGQRYVLGYAFTWDDLLTDARDRARSLGERQRVIRDGDTWLVLPAIPPGQDSPK
jgi:hypothetical protein